VEVIVEVGFAVGGGQWQDDLWLQNGGYGEVDRGVESHAFLAEGFLDRASPVVGNGGIRGTQNPRSGFNFGGFFLVHDLKTGVSGTKSGGNPGNLHLSQNNSRVILLSIPK